MKGGVYRILTNQTTEKEEDKGRKVLEMKKMERRRIVYRKEGYKADGKG